VERKKFGLKKAARLQHGVKDNKNPHQFCEDFLLSFLLQTTQMNTSPIIKYLLFVWMWLVILVLITFFAKDLIMPKKVVTIELRICLKSAECLAIECYYRWWIKNYLFLSFNTLRLIGEEKKRVWTIVSVPNREVHVQQRAKRYPSDSNFLFQELLHTLRLVRKYYFFGIQHHFGAVFFLDFFSQIIYIY